MCMRGEASSMVRMRNDVRNVKWKKKGQVQLSDDWLCKESKVYLQIEVVS